MDLFITGILLVEAAVLVAILAVGGATNTNKKLFIALLLFFIGMAGVVVSNF